MEHFVVSRIIIGQTPPRTASLPATLRWRHQMEVQWELLNQTRSVPIWPSVSQAGILLMAVCSSGTSGPRLRSLRDGATGFFCIGASCSHYGGPLAEGLMVEDTIRCPWHHACFSLRTGKAIYAPAFNPVDCWSVEERHGKIYVREKSTPDAQELRAPLANAPDRIVIIGGGAAGFAAAQRLRDERFKNSIVMLSNDDAPPVDRPNLSKDYLAGNAPEEWIPLRPDGFYAENSIDLRLRANVAAIDVRSREVALGDGSRIAYDRLLLATGAEPIRLSIPGADQPHVHTLRSLADCRAIIEGAKAARRVVILGASFIGLEVAASLRTRGIEVHVVAPDKRPMERIRSADG